MFYCGLIRCYDAPRTEKKEKNIFHVKRGSVYATIWNGIVRRLSTEERQTTRPTVTVEREI